LELLRLSVLSFLQPVSMNRSVIAMACSAIANALHFLLVIDPSVSVTQYWSTPKPDAVSI